MAIAVLEMGDFLLLCELVRLAGDVAVDAVVLAWHSCADLRLLIARRLSWQLLFAEFFNARSLRRGCSASPPCDDFEPFFW